MDRGPNKDLNTSCLVLPALERCVRMWRSGPRCDAGPRGALAGGTTCPRATRVHPIMQSTDPRPKRAYDSGGGKDNGQNSQSVGEPPSRGLAGAIESARVHRPDGVPDDDMQILAVAVTARESDRDVQAVWAEVDR